MLDDGYSDTAALYTCPDHECVMHRAAWVADDEPGTRCPECCAQGVLAVPGLPVLAPGAAAR